MVGLQTAAVNCGGDTGSLVATTETYDGSSWTTEGNSLTAAKELHSMAGISTLAVAWGGSTGSDSATSEEWAVAITAQTVTDS